MLNVFQNWMTRYFADEESIILCLILFVGMAIVILMGEILAPVIASIIIAFLLQGVVQGLTRYNCPRILAVTLAFLLFVGLSFAVLLVILPMVWQQLTNLFNELPNMMTQGQEALNVLTAQYPDLISEEQIKQIIAMASSELGQVGQFVVSFSLSTIPNLVAVVIYLILIPILVFFFIKDGGVILTWFTGFLPTKRPLLSSIWQEMNLQIANYVRGKAIEILAVGVVSYITFIAMGLNYAALLGLLVGFSVVVPYIGAALVTFPVVAIAFFQWGFGSEFAYLLVAYGIIQALDGNVLVPILFSEAVDLHPVAIIVAVLVFGGLWGLWGVFFAIPLATLVKALIEAWPESVDTVSNAG